MKYYDRDSSAEAAVLYDYADTYFKWSSFEDAYVIITNYKLRIKVFKKSALGRATHIIPYIHSTFGATERITDIKGFTYNLVNGEIETTRLEKEAIVEEQVVNNRYAKKIIMPNVKEGSVFEFSYVLETPFSVTDKPHTWYFQEDIPNEWSEINVMVPNNLGYKIITGGYYSLAVNHSEPVIDYKRGDGTSSIQLKLATKNLPAVKEEPFAPVRSDYISKAEFELSTYKGPNGPTRVFSRTWEDLNKFLVENEHFGEQMKSRGYLRDIADGFRNEKDSIAIINSVFKYVSANIKWEGLNNTIYAQQDLKKVVQNRKGSTAEINLLLVALLRELGFEANPVILSTRQNGRFKKDYPMLDDFNYVIAAVNLGGRDILMDATDPLTYPGLLPERCLNEKGLLIKKNGGRFVSLEPSEKYSKYEYITADLNAADGRLTGEYSLTCGGYMGLMERHSIKDGSEKEVMNMIKDYRSQWQIDSFKLDGKDNSREPLKITCRFTAENPGSSSGIIYLNPVLCSAITYNPFNASDRMYPIEYEKPVDRIYVATIKIPAGYKVEEMPKAATIVLPDGGMKFVYSVDTADNLIRVSCRFSITTTNYKADNYRLLKEFYNKMIKKYSEQVVLKKIS